MREALHRNGLHVHRAPNSSLGPISETLYQISFPKPLCRLSFVSDASEVWRKGCCKGSFRKNNFKYSHLSERFLFIVDGLNATFNLARSRTSTKLGEVMSIAVNYTHPFNIPQGPDFHETYFVGETITVSWTLPSNVSVSLEYTNDTDEAYQDSSNIWTFLSAFSRTCLFPPFPSFPSPDSRCICVSLHFNNTQAANI